MQTDSETIHGSDPCQPRRSQDANFTRKGNTLYMHVHFWLGEYVAISGLPNKVLRASILKTNRQVAFTQDGFQAKFTNLPIAAPDEPVTTIAIECDSEPRQDTDYVRINKPPRNGIGAARLDWKVGELTRSGCSREI